VVAIESQLLPETLLPPKDVSSDYITYTIILTLLNRTLIEGLTNEIIVLISL
jgi:hypothetical protein